MFYWYFLSNTPHFSIREPKKKHGRPHDPITSNVTKMSYYKTYKGKKLGPYDYPRKTHFFTAEDVARIAKIVAARDGNSAVKVFATIAVALGFGALICKAARGIASVLTLWFWFQKVGIAVGLAEITTLIINLLVGMKLIAPPGVKVILAITIAALTLFNDILSVLQTVIGDVAVLHDISSTLNDLCRNVKEITGETIDNVCDATGDTCKNYRDIANNTANMLRSDVDNAINILDIEKPESWF